MTEIIIPDSVYSGILQDNNISSSITSDKSLVEKNEEVKEKKINIPTNISKDIIIPQTVYDTLDGPTESGSFSDEPILSEEDELKVGKTNGFARFEKLLTSGFKYRADDAWYSLLATPASWFLTDEQQLLAKADIQGEMTDEEVRESLNNSFYQYYNKQVDARTEAKKETLKELGALPQGFYEKLVFSAGAIPVDFARYIPALLLTRNPAYAIGLTDAYFASEEGPVEAAKAGAKGFVIGKVLQWAGPLAWHQRVPIGAGIGFTLSPGELEDRLVGATLFGGMSLIPTGRKNLDTVVRDIERKRQKYGEHNQTLVERMQGKPKDESSANYLLSSLKRDVSDGQAAIKKNYEITNSIKTDLTTAKKELTALEKDKSLKIKKEKQGLAKMLDADPVGTAKQKVKELESKLKAQGKATLKSDQFHQIRINDDRVANKYAQESLDTRSAFTAKRDAFELTPDGNIMKPVYKDIPNPEFTGARGIFSYASLRGIFPKSIFDKISSNPLMNWVNSQRQTMFEKNEQVNRMAIDDPVSYVYSNPEFSFVPTFVVSQKTNKGVIKKTFKGEFAADKKTIKDDGGAKDYLSKLRNKENFEIRRSEDVLFRKGAVVPLTKALEEVAGPQGMYYLYNKLPIKSQDKVREVMATKVERNYMDYLHYREQLINPKKFEKLSDKQVNTLNQRVNNLKVLFDENTGEVTPKALKEFYKLTPDEVAAYTQIRSSFSTALDYLNRYITIFDPNAKPIEKIPNFYPHRFLDNFVVKVANKAGKLIITEPMPTAKAAREAVKKYNDPNSAFGKKGFKARYESNNKVYRAENSNLQVHAEALMHHKAMKELSPELRGEIYNIRSVGLLAAPNARTRRRRLDFVKGYFGSKKGIEGVKDFVFVGKTYISGTYAKAHQLEFNYKLKQLLEPLTDAKIYRAFEGSEKGLVSIPKSYPNVAKAIRLVVEDMNGLAKDNRIDNFIVGVANTIYSLPKDVITFPVRAAKGDKKIRETQLTRKQVDEFFGGFNFFLAFTRLFSFNARFTAAQGIQPTQMIVPKLYRLRELTGGKVDPYRAWADSLKEMMYVTPETMRFLEGVQKKGVINNKFMKEFMNEAIFQKAGTPSLARKEYMDRLKNGDYYGVLARLGYKISGMNITGRVEQFSRLQAALMFRSIYKQLGVKSEKKIIDNAANFADIYMVRYHYIDRADVFGHRGLSLAGKPIGLFKTFQQNYLAALTEHTKNLVRDGDVKGFGAFMISGLLTAGIHGLVGIQTVDSGIQILNRMFKSNIPTLSYLLYDNELLPEFMIYGVPSSTLGVDLTSTLSAPSISPTQLFSIPGYQVMSKMAMEALPNFIRFASPFADVKPTREQMRDSIKLFMPTPFHAALEVVFQRDDAMFINKERGVIRRDMMDWFARWMASRSIEEAGFIKASYMTQQLKKNTQYSYDALVDYAASELFHRGIDSALLNYLYDMALNDFGKDIEAVNKSIKTRLTRYGESVADKLAKGGVTALEKKQIKMFLNHTKASNLGFETKETLPPLNIFKGDEYLFY